MNMKKRIISKSPYISNTIAKPSTITRAALTADLKLTRGKQLVEHNPFLLIPDPNNPRPGDEIDDKWLKEHLRIGTTNSLCFFNQTNNTFHIPTFDDLKKTNKTIKDTLRDDYNFLRDLAFSIRRDGLIEPIEIFLADKNNDLEYFKNISDEFGYVILEGHQRRLAAMIGEVQTVTCIEITDETTLARLKVKHRKLRRQLSENNLRKGLTITQNFLLVKEIINDDEGKLISVKELSSIIGLNEDIAGALRRLCLNYRQLPPEMIKLVETNSVSFKWIRAWVGKPYSEIQQEIDRLKSKNEINPSIGKKKVKPRGYNGGAVKRSATFRVKDVQDTNILRDYLLKKIPEAKIDFDPEQPFYALEKILFNLLSLAKKAINRPGSDVPINP